MTSLVIGLAAGLAVGLLLAPAPGRVTRRRLGRMAEDLGEKAREGVGEVKDFVSDQAHRASDALHRRKHEA
jgi:gas vesicle protein